MQKSMKQNESKLIMVPRKAKERVLKKKIGYDLIETVSTVLLEAS